MHYRIKAMFLFIVIFSVVLAAIFIKNEKTVEGSSVTYPIRQAVIPAWQVDLTDGCVRNDGLTMEQVLSRERRATVDDSGKRYTYSVESVKPKKKTPHGLVLCFDTTAVTGVRCNGKPLEIFTLGAAWNGLERFSFLPVNSGKYKIDFDVMHLTELYPNAFGRVVMRPATLNEAVVILKPQKNSSELTLKNNGYHKENITVDIASTDYFGMVLANNAVQVSLSPQEEKTVTAGECPKECWKTSYRLKQGESSSHVYYDFHHQDTWYTCRNEMMKLWDGWQIAPAEKADDPGVAPQNGWSDSAFPLKSPNDKTHFLWLKNKVTIPDRWSGKELCLYFPVLQYKADVFVNGENIGSLFRWQTPEKLKLPGSIKCGEEIEIQICLTDYIAGLRSGTPIPKPGEKVDRDFVAPIGHIDGDGALACLITPPELIAEPPVRVEDASIRTFTVGEKRIETNIEIVNDSNDPVNAVLNIAICRNGKQVKELTAKTVAISPDKASTLQIKENFGQAELWTPDNPCLYEMRLTLRTKDGEVLDIRRERFGMRELTSSQHRFLLNGEKFKPYGFSVWQPYQKTWPHQPMAYTYYRHMHNAGNLDISWSGCQSITNIQIGDELGYCASYQDGFHNEHHRYRFDRSDNLIWDNLSRSYEQMIKHLHNHPSIIMWGLGNENYLKQEGAAEKMGELFAKVKELDPTRFITLSGPTHIPQGPAVQTVTPHGWCEADRKTFFMLHPEKRPYYMKNKGLFNYIPDGENKQDWAVAESTIPLNRGKYLFTKQRPPLRHVEGRTVIFGECMYHHAHSFPGLSGESMFYTSGRWYGTLDNAVGRKYMVRMTRHAEPAAYLGHVAGKMTRDLAPVCAFVADQKLRFHSDEKVAITLDVFNAHYIENDVTVNVALFSRGKPVANKKQTLKMGVCDKKNLIFDFGKFTANHEDLRFDLMIDVRSSRGAYFNEWEEIHILKNSEFTLPDSTKLSVFDPKEIVLDFLADKDVEFDKLDSLDDWKAGENALLLVAPDSLDDNAVARKLGKILDHDGGRIIVMEHDSLADVTPIGLSLSNEEINTFTYPSLRDDSPLYGEIIPDDLRFWQTTDDDLLVARKMINLPVKGNFRIYASGNYADGVKAKSTPLIEVGVGKGSVIYSQLNLGRALGKEPVADRLLALLLKAPITITWKSAGVICSQEKLGGIRANTGLMAQEIYTTGDLDDIDILLADANALEGLDDALKQEILPWVNRGGELLIQSITEKHKKILSEILKEDIEIAGFPLDRARFVKNEKLTRGISNETLFWDLRSDGANQRIKYVDENKPMEPMTIQPGHDIIKVQGGINLALPAYLVRKNYGSGRINFSSLRIPEIQIAEAKRLYCMLLTNLGVKLDTEATAKMEIEALTKYWDYIPVDISQSANRGFENDKANGVIGWTAKGTDDDMSQFPTGEQQFCSIPFHVLDKTENKGKTCIAVSHPSLNLEAPSEVRDIPVKKKLDRLIFLWGAACRGVELNVRIYYAERKSWIPGAPDPFVDLPVRPGIEIDDWYSANAYLSGEKSLPSSRLAWSGYSHLTKRLGFPVGVFMNIWDNPHPEKEIDAIDIYVSDNNSSNKGIVFLMGLDGSTRK